MPGCWKDLIKPAYKGEVQMANPNSSGTAYTTLATIVQLLGEDEGFDFMKALHKNINQYTKSGSAPIKAAARGENTIGIVFLQLGDTARRGRLTRSDGFFKFVLRRAPRIGRLMGAVFDLLGALFMAIILFGAAPDLIEAWEKDFFVGEIGLFTAPEWPIKAVIVVGCLMTLLQFLVFGWRYLSPKGVEPVHHVASID